MKYFYNICYIKVPNEHIDLKRKVCVILILPLTIPCCQPTNHMCNNGLFINPESTFINRYLLYYTSL